MKKIVIIYYIFVILLGISMFIYGGYDDSPGGQLLGFVAILIGIKNIYLYKKNKKC